MQTTHDHHGARRLITLSRLEVRDNLLLGHGPADTAELVDHVKTRSPTPVCLTLDCNMLWEIAQDQLVLAITGLGHVNHLSDRNRSRLRVLCGPKIHADLRSRHSQVMYLILARSVAGDEYQGEQDVCDLHVCVSLSVNG
jgi:hypothetical protein